MKPNMQLKPICPFEPISTSCTPAGGNWVTQIKWDGVRMLLYYDGHETKLFNRKLNERTNQYPEFQDIRSFCNARSVILDGEIIAFDESKPSFHEVMKRDSLKQLQRIKQSINQVIVTYMIFDILFVDGEWVTDRPLEHRQKLLESIITPNHHVQIVQNFHDGAALFNLMKQHRMEGVVFKDLTSTYSINGKDGRWKKLKVMNDLFAIVGGVTFRHKVVNSLLLGVYTNERDLVYIGHAGTGKLTQKDWAAITEEVILSRISQRPFINEPQRSKDAIWVKPELTVKIEYLELTPGGTMRHPSIQAVVDVGKNECTADQIKEQ